jgi:hypothetical protein
MIVSFCDLSGEGIDDSIKIEQWDNVPPVSEDYRIARDAILKNIESLWVELESNHE